MATYPTYVNSKTRQRVTPQSAGVNHLYATNKEWTVESAMPPATAPAAETPKTTKKLGD